NHQSSLRDGGQRMKLLFPQKCSLVTQHLLRRVGIRRNLHLKKRKYISPSFTPRPDHILEKLSIALIRNHISFSLIPERPLNFKPRPWANHRIPVRGNWKRMVRQQRKRWLSFEHLSWCPRFHVSPSRAATDNPNRYTQLFVQCFSRE